MAKNAGVNIKIGASLKKFSTEMQNVKRELRRTARQMKSIGTSMTASLTLPLGVMSVAMVKFASDTQESLNKVDVAFGDSSQAVKDFSKTTLKSFGIANSTALEMASTFGDMATSMGITQGVAANMSTKLVGLAGDLASFKNIRIDVAQTALNSIFTGETESLKKLGIVMTQANLAAFALEKGIKKPITAMSEGEKVMLRYQFVMEKTANAHGDFERTGGGAANQMRIFQEGVKELSASFGEILLPFFTKAVKKLNEVVQWFGNLSEKTKKVIIVVGGLVAVTGPLLVALGSLLPMLGAIKVAFTTLTGPVGIVIGLLGALAFKYLYLSDVKKKQIAITKQLYSTINAETEIRKRVQQSVFKERAEIEALLSVARDETKAKRERLSAIQRLNSINPQYISGITLENVNTEKVTSSIKRYIESLKDKARVQAATAILQEQYDEQIKNEIRLNNTLEDQAANRAKREKELADMIAGKNMQGELTDEALQNERNSIERSNAEYQKQIDLLKAKSKAISDNIAKAIQAGGVEGVKPQGVTTPTFDTPTGGNTTRTFDVLSVSAKKYADQLKLVTSATMVAQQATADMDATTYASMLSYEQRMAQFADNMKNAMVNLKQGLQQLAVETFEGLFVAIGQAASGVEGAFKDFGKNVLSSVAEFMGQFGKLLIAGAIASEAMQKALFTNPAIALAAGIGLVAVAGLIKGLSKQNPTTYGGGSSGYSPTTTYAAGGVGSQALHLETTGVLYGSDILLSVQAQNNTVGRTRKR